MRASTVVFIVSSLLQAAATTVCALWPLAPSFTTASVLAAFATYTPGNSNVDVWCLTLLNITILAALVWFAAAGKPSRQGFGFRPHARQRHTRAIKGVRCTALCFQLLLLTKAVTVAIVGSDQALPTKQGNPGLILIYVATVGALVTSFAQSPAAQAIVRRWKASAEATAAALLEDESSRSSESSSVEATGPGGLATPLLLSNVEKAKDVSSQEPRQATIGALLRLSAADTPILLLAFTAGAVAALGQALVPYFTGRIVDYASIDPDPAAFRRTTVKLLGVAAACALFTGIRGGLFTIAMTRLNMRLRHRLFASLLRQDPGFYDVTKTGEISSRLSADTTTVSDQICLNLNVMLRSATQAAMVLGFMFTASWRLTVVTFVMVPLVLAICKVYGAYYRRLSKKVQAELAGANAVAEEAIGTMTTVKAHAAEGSVEAAYTSKLGAFYILQRKEAIAYSLYMTTNTFLSAAVVAAVLFYGGNLVLAGRMSSGALVSFLLYQQSLSAAFQALGDVFSALSAAVGAADKVIELMNRQPAFQPGGTLAATDFFGRIELRDVRFAYPARPQAQVLRGFSLTIEPGEVVALVGPSGGGKSSIVKLVERFYLPTAGSVLIDGRDVGIYDAGWFRRRVALVSQEPVLYARSIKRNIKLGLEPEDGVPPEELPTDAEVEEAARLANAHDFISALPEGYDTECGERGVQLSGGQKQRIAIARALVRRPAVLLLDEATSALDADSEATVQEALDRTMAGRTVLLIAHRLSTVQNASRIVVVQGGEAVESGTHEGLLARGGAYAALVKRQLARASSSASLAGHGGGGSMIG